MAGAGMPSGEWACLVMRYVTPDMAVAALSAQTGYVVVEIRHIGKIENEAGAAIDFHDVRRYDKKPGLELVRGGGKNTKSKVFYETYGSIQ